MNTKLNECNPSICNNDFLMTDGGEIITVEDVKERCICINRQVCATIVELLQENKKKDALELIKQIEG